MEYLVFLLLIVAIVTPFVVADRRAKKRDALLASSPICKDCIHSTYLSVTSSYDRWDWGIEWSSQDGWYCKKSEYKIASGGAAITGYDKKRLRKCADVRQRGCGPGAEWFEPKDAARGSERW